MDNEEEAAVFAYFKEDEQLWIYDSRGHYVALSYKDILDLKEFLTTEVKYNG